MIILLIQRRWTVLVFRVPFIICDVQYMRIFVIEIKKFCNFEMFRIYKQFYPKFKFVRADKFIKNVILQFIDRILFLKH